jgi:hypothetical protein
LFRHIAPNHWWRRRNATKLDVPIGRNGANGKNVNVIVKEAMKEVENENAVCPVGLN